MAMSSIICIKVINKDFNAKHGLTENCTYQVHAIDPYQTEDGKDDTKFLIISNKSKKFVWVPMEMAVASSLASSLGPYARTV
jgi:hypothetical protein